MSDVSVKVDGLQEVGDDLARLADQVATLPDAVAAVSREYERVGRSFTPRRGGALAGTATATWSGMTATLAWGSARVAYAGPIFYGWRKRGIKPAGTPQKTDAVMRDRAPELFDGELGRLFDRYGF